MNRHRSWRRAALLTASIAAIAHAAHALPTGGTVAAATNPGTATINSTPTTMTINQTAQRVVIDWSTFNIANGETVTFSQPSASAIAFNRIGSISPTTINGALNANGAVFLFSPGGMIFGPNANVNVGSFLTSMGSFANADINTNLTATSLAFDLVATGPTQPAPVFDIQAGAQITANAGFVDLIGPSITQNGDVTASDSVTYMVSEGGGLNFTETPTGLIYDSGVFRKVNGRGRLSFNHNGTTTAGKNVRVVTPAPMLEAGFHAVLNLSGTVEAGTLGTNGGNGFVLLTTATVGATAPTNDSTISFDASGAVIIAPLGLTAAGTDITLGAVDAGDVSVDAWRNFTATGPVLSANGFEVLTHSPGTANFNADVAAGGFMRISAFGPVNVQAGRTLIGSGLEIEAGGPVSVGDNASLASDGELSIETDGLLTIGNGALIATVGGQELISQTWPIGFANGDNGAGGIVLNAGDIDLRGTVVSSYDTGPGDIVLVIRSTNGVIGGGADAVPGSYTLSNAEFQRLIGRTVLIGASTNDGAPGADIQVQDLVLDSSHLGRLVIGTEGRDINVTGTVSGSGSGPVDVDIGTAILFYSPTANEDGFFAVPQNINITGALGTADQPLGRVRMIATGDILMGSSGFVQAVAADPQFNPNAPNNLPAPSPGHIFVAASGLQMTVPDTGRIIQQNSGAALEEAGLLIGAPTAQQTLIVTPDLLALATQLGAAYGYVLPPDASAPNFSSGPAVISLHAEFLASGGQPAASGFDVAASPYLLPPGVSSQSDYRFNGCGAGASGCASAGETQTAITFQSPVEVADTASEQLDEGLALGQAEGEVAVSEAQELVTSFLALPNDEDEEEKDKLSQSVTGSGNGDLWRTSPEGAKP